MFWINKRYRCVRSSGGVMLAEQEVRGSIPGLVVTISEIDDLLLSSHDMAEISR